MCIQVFELLIVNKRTQNHNCYMDISEEELVEISKWRQERHLCFEAEKAEISVGYKRSEPKNFHFFNYDPSLGPTDLSNVSLKRDDTHDPAVFSIPLSFTESSRAKYQSHQHGDLGLDIQAFMTPHNAPIYPLKK